MVLKILTIHNFAFDSCWTICGRETSTWPGAALCVSIPLVLPSCPCSVTQHKHKIKHGRQDTGTEDK